MFGNRKLISPMYWINKNTRSIESMVERSVHSTLMMNKAII